MSKLMGTFFVVRDKNTGWFFCEHGGYCDSVIDAEKFFTCESAEEECEKYKMELEILRIDYESHVAKELNVDVNS